MAQTEDFSIDRGSDVTIELYFINKDLTKKNLTGYTLSGKMKTTHETTDSADITTFVASIPSPVTDGIGTLKLTNLVTDALTPQRYVYDAELSHLDSSANTIIERVVEGQIEVTKSTNR